MAIGHMLIVYPEHGVKPRPLDNRPTIEDVSSALDEGSLRLKHPEVGKFHKLRPLQLVAFPKFIHRSFPLMEGSDSPIIFEEMRLMEGKSVQVCFDSKAVPNGEPANMRMTDYLRQQLWTADGPQWLRFQLFVGVAQGNYVLLIGENVHIDEIVTIPIEIDD